MNVRSTTRRMTNGATEVVKTVACSLLMAAALIGLGSCGGGGGGAATTERPEGVYTGFSASGDLDWTLPPDTGGGGGGDSGIGAGADGDGGIGAGGDFGQFRNALLVVKYPDGSPVGNGEALTDPTSGMVTIKPRKGYQGPLYLELRGGPNATYYEEGKDTFVPFPEGQVIRGWVPRIDKNIGLTPFTDAAYRLLTEGSTPERAAGATPTAAEIAAANNKVRDLLNEQFPAPLAVDDITRLPFIKSPSVAGQITTNPRGVYGLVNGAFSKQAAMFNVTNPAPTLAAQKQLGEDFLDGKLDGMRGSGQPAVPANERTYDPHSITGELTSALAEQSFRFGTQNARDLLPKVLNFGTSRYEGYLFDASLKPGGQAVTTVAGWIGEDSLGRPVGSESPPKIGGRVFTVYGNFGHGGVFLKADAPNSQSKLYAFGDNVNGELGNGELGVGTRGGAGLAGEITLPVQAALTHIVGGFAHTVARFADGSVYAWGGNAYGQLGQGQDASVLPRSATPLKVTLPAGAAAVASTNTASYALLVDGRVYSWGSSWGFGLLGDGAKNSVRNAPGPVLAPDGQPLTDVVQLAARDNDAIALKRDGTVWTWGSFPSDITGGYVPSAVTLPYNGGSPLPTQIVGLPSGLQVRKVLTEQGLFLALMSDGTVYHWGVHFDLTANDILRDLTPVRVLGLPKARDLMPGGFIGYGARPFDRLTAMAIDYRGGLWKTRGRVAEQFDPANPSQQRRPKSQEPRTDCKTCHVPLDTWPLDPPAVTSTAACVIPSLIHGTTDNPAVPTLIHADTKCQLCHNPNLKTATVPTGWLNCVAPTNLPARPVATLPPTIQSACTVPTGHVFTPPGTPCATCHNSIIARPLQSLTPPCTQPPVGALPTISTTTQITNIVNDANVRIAPGGVTSDISPTLQGSLSAALANGESVVIRRDGIVAGNASVTPAGSTTWTFTDNGASNGTRVYTVRVEAGTAFGPTSGSYTIIIDTIAPTATANVTGISGDGNAVPNGGASSDTTPTVSGTLTAAIAGDESVRIVRNNVLTAATATVTGTNWTFTEPSALADGTYSYQARVIDAAGNLGALGAAWSVVINSTLPTATITSAFNDNDVVIPANGVTNDTTPRFTGTVGAALLQGQIVKIVRSGVTLAGNATVTGTNWTFTDPGAPSAQHSYIARVEQGSLQGQNSAPYPILIDAVAPTTAATVTSLTDGNLGPVANGGISTDDTPTIGGTLSAALGAGGGSTEAVQLVRDGSPVGGSVSVNSTTWTFTEPTALTAGTYRYQARVVDAAGNVGGLGTTSWSVTINTTERTAGIVGADADNGPGIVMIPNNGATSDPTPTIRGTVNAALSALQWVRVYRSIGGGAAVQVSGEITPNANLGWSFPDSRGVGSVTQNVAYTARVESAAANGPLSQPYSFLIDSQPPTQTVTISAFSNQVPFSTAPAGTPSFTHPASNVIVSQTNDPSPTVRFALSAALGSGESLSITRVIGGQSSTISPNLLSACAGVANCFEFSDATTGVLIPVPGTGSATAPNTGLPVAASYSARVVDAVGNQGPPVGSPVTKSFNFDYFICDQARALLARNASQVPMHSNIAAGTCTGQCHVPFPAAPSAPAYYSVAATQYWCRRSNLN